MSNLYIERAIAIFGMSLWLLFPLGMLISFIQQQRHARYPTLSVGKGGHYNYAYYSGEEGKTDDSLNEEREEEREEENFENEGGHNGDKSDENGLLHYLKGREKLHGDRPPKAPESH